MFSLNSNASHITAGEMYYDYLGNNDYEVHLLIYRDCAGIEYDEILSFTVFDQANNVIQEVSIVLDTNNIQQVDYTTLISQQCLAQFSGACLEYYTYSKVVNLPPIVGGYLLSYQRCCLTAQIVNIESADQYGYTFHSKIPGLETGQYENSSPRFQGHSLFLACLNETESFMHPATDPDGDSLVYSILTPYSTNSGGGDPSPELPPPYTPLTYDISFSAQAPLGIGGILVINPVTAEMIVKPVYVGMFSIGVKVDEYKSDTLINTTYRNLSMQVGLSNVGIHDDQLSGGISIHPNPVVNDVEIRCKRKHALTIFSAEGKVVFSRTDSNERTYKVDMSSFDSGVYYFQFESEYGKEVRKVCKPS